MLEYDDEIPMTWSGIIMSWLFAPFAVLLGVVLTTQVATNTQLGKALGNDYIPASVNMIIGLVATVILTWSLTSDWPSREMVRAAPWYAWFAGGLMGTIYLTGNILLAPRLGAGELVGLVVAGQLLFAVLLDNFGWLGFEQHSASIPRLAGCALMIAGVFLVSKF
jgi:transporter family-2 protein